MKLAALILVALLVVTLTLWLAAKKRTQQPDFKNLNGFIQHLADQAVQDAQSQNHVQLDYSVNSIKTVDEVLEQIHARYSKNPSLARANALASAYGAYVGEAIRRSEPGVRWEVNSATGGEKSYPLFWAKWESFPMAWCYRRIVNGSEDNVWVKYRLLKDRLNDTSTPESK